MRGCLTTIVFLLITSGLSTFMFGSAFFIAVLLDPDAGGWQAVRLCRWRHLAFCRAGDGE